MFDAILYILIAAAVLSAAALIAARALFKMSWRDTLRRLVEFFS